MKRSHRMTWGPTGPLVLFGALVVLSSVLAQLSVWPVHMLQRHAIRHEMKDRILAGLPKSALTVFRYSPKEFEEVDFIDGGREIRVGEIMYDIVRTYQDHGSWVIEAAQDDKETKLMVDLDRMVRGRLAADQRGQEQRTRMVASWAPFCDPLSTVQTWLPTARTVDHCEPSAMKGRGIEAIDPGPPRKA